MKRAAIMTACLCLVVLMAAFASAQSSDEQQVRAAEQSLAQAESRNDSAPVKAMLATDWVTVTPDGRVLQKDEIVNSIAEHEGQMKPYVVELADLKVVVAGQNAFCTFIREYHGTMGEAKDKVARQSVVHVFAKSTGTWKLHYERAQPIPDKGNP